MSTDAAWRQGLEARAELAAIDERLSQAGVPERDPLPPPGMRLLPWTRRERLQHLVADRDLLRLRAKRAEAERDHLARLLSQVVADGAELPGNVWAGPGTPDGRAQGGQGGHELGEQAGRGAAAGGE